MGIMYEIILSKDQVAMLGEIGEDIHVRRKRRYGDLSGTGWTDSRINKVVRSLYGILALAERPHTMRIEGRLYRWRRIDHIYVPEENREAVDIALKTNGLFGKEVENEDLPVLKSVYDRNKELRGQYGNWLSPRFHVSEVARRTRREKADTRNSLTRLVGILAKTTIRAKKELGAPEDSGGSNEMYSDSMHRWFLPPARVKDAEKILRKYQGLSDGP